MAEDPQPGPVSPQRRPAIGARLAMGFLAVVRTILVFLAGAVLMPTFLFIVVGCFSGGSARSMIAIPFGSLVIAELLIAMAVGAKWIKEVIHVRHQHPGGGGPDPLKPVGHQVVMMTEVVMFVSAFCLIVWIPAEIARIRNMGIAWPVCWAVVGGAAFWARRLVSKWIERRSLIPDTDPCSTLGTPPSSEP